MKKNITISLLLLVTLLVSSCSQGDIVVDNTTIEDTYLVQRQPNTLEVLNTTNQSFTNLNLSANIGEVQAIKKFREKYYLINQAQQRIYVIEHSKIDEALNSTLGNISITTVDFAANNLIPVDICFPNATDAYIAFSNSNKIGILDLTNNQMSGITIELAGNPAHIAGAGNQVYVTCPAANTVAIIDTRTNEVEANISIAGNPTLVAFTAGGSKVAVITTGGAENTNKEAAKLFAIDVESREITLERTLVSDANVSKKLTPQACITTTNMLYVACHNIDNNLYGGIRIPTSNFRTSYSMLRNNCDFVGYSNIYNTLFFVEEDNISIFNASNNALHKSIPLSGEVLAIAE